MTPDLNDPLSAPFWRGVEAGELRMCWCESCDAAVWYPQAQCRTCESGTSWRTLSGDAVLYSWTSVEMPINPKFKAPYIAALVTPVEAPAARIVTQIVEADVASLRCDMPVSVVFRKLELADGSSYVAPLFRP